MTYAQKHRLHSVISLVLAVIMVLSVSPMSIFAADEVQGAWTITNDGTSSGVAKYGKFDLAYYSPTTNITYGNAYEKDWVRSSNCNGSAKDGIVVTESKSYVKFTPEYDGTLLAYIGNAASKTGYVSKTKGEESTAIGSFVPGGSDNYDAPGFKVYQGGTNGVNEKMAELDIEVEAGTDYYITVSGSKMLFYDPEFVPYTKVSGTINDSFNLGSYPIKFVSKETGEVFIPEVSGNSYSITLKPGDYSAALTGSSATSYAVSAATRNVTVEGSDTTAPKSQTADLAIEESVSYKVSGNLVGMDKTYDDMKVVFVSADQASHEDVTAEISGNTYSAQLAAGETYTAKLEGAEDYEMVEEVVVTNDSANPVTKDITFKAKDLYTISGSFIKLGSERYSYIPVTDVAFETITFTNVDDKYTYKADVKDNKYTVALRKGSYQASIDNQSTGYTTTTHVVVDGENKGRDLLLKEEDKTVGYTHDDVFYVGKDKEFKTVQAAVDAIGRMGSVQGDSSKPVTVKIDPGVYREQVVVNRPNITFESNGGDASNTKITWYYGIGYKYYSCVNSVYDPYADYDQFDKGDVQSYWGTCVLLQKGAENFKAEGITFENSFNKYMTDEEILDGVAPNGKEAINVQRKENTNVDTKAATERAAALVNYADKVEFKDCSFIGSQDTLYTSNVPSDAYFKNCYIEGQTDFIYGNGDVIFDACELNFCGYDGSANAGYLTAQSSSATNKATDGYIFRNCYVSYNSERMTAPGTYGRMWGDNATVAFINTVLQEKDMIQAAGWTEMSGKKPTDSGMQLVEYNTTYNGQPIDTTGRVVAAKDSIDQSKYTVESVFIKNGWTPVYYTPEASGKAAFKTMPTLTSNGDLNTPNPGETLTAVYELEDAFAPNDASKIEWYAVSEGYDASSLDNVLRSASLLKSTTALNGKKFQIPMAAAGKYLMVVVTPMATGSESGDAAYYIDTEKPVSDVWSNPDNEKEIAPGSGINIYLAGDSTVKDYSADGMYNSGKIQTAGSWGEFLQAFFDDSYVKVNDYAQGGRSSRSFINEGKLDNIKKNIKKGDYLFVQFAHNDCANQAGYTQERFVPLYTKEAQPTSKSSGFPTVRPVESMKTASPDSYKSTYGDTYYAWDCGATYKGFMQEYIEAALEVGAIPVIVTPVARMYYDESGKIKTHHDATDTTSEAGAFTTENNAYVTACHELYEENKDRGALLIDAYGITVDMFEGAYAEGGEALGAAVMDKGDKTHSNKTGGVIQAGYIAKAIKDMDISISQYVKQPKAVYGEEASGDFIFTIDKEGKFTAKDKQLVEQPYWEGLGQELFDSLASADSEPQPEPEPQPKDDVHPVMANANGNSFVASSSVDSLAYQEVGFVFEFGDKKVEKSTQVVYGSTEESTYTAADLGSKYMYSFEITDMPAGSTNLKVTPFVVYVNGEKELGRTEEYIVESDGQTITGLVILERSTDDTNVNVAEASESTETSESKTEENSEEKAGEEADETAVEAKDETAVIIDIVASESAFVFEPEEEVKEAS